MAEVVLAGLEEAPAASAYAAPAKRNSKRTAAAFATGSEKFRPASTRFANSARCAAKLATPFHSAPSRLVGYTNAGKSTLFNALSRAEVLVSSRMFATLDPTIRALRLPSNRRVLVSDTVGFIRDLPKGLLTAFRATLEEVQEAALIVHVSDASNPHHDELDAEVKKILDELGVAGRPTLRVLNKVDLLTPEHRAELEASIAGANGSGSGPVLVSGLTGAGIDDLLRRIDAELPTDPMVALSLRLPLTEGRTLALIHAMGRVLHSQVDESHMLLEAEVPVSIGASAAPEQVCDGWNFRGRNRVTSSG